MTPQEKWEARTRAAQACIDRFEGKPYEPGKRDCVQMAKHCLHHLGRRVGQSKLPRYSSDRSGIKALRAMGFKTLVEAVDSTDLVKIPAASAVMGDIVALPSDDEAFGAALTVAVGGGRVLGFQDGVCRVLQPSAFVAAWRTV